MGTSTSWIAVHGASQDEVAQALQLVALPPGYENAKDALYEAAMLPSGWLLLLQRLRDDGVVAARGPLEALSRTWRVVGCDEESHVMYSASSEWQRGREVWAIIHASERSIDHLDVRGQPPDGWVDIRNEYLGKQAAAESDDVDHVYEAPLVVAQQIVRYRTESDEDDLTFVSLGRRAKPRWKFW